MSQRTRVFQESNATKLNDSIDKNCNVSTNIRNYCFRISRLVWSVRLRNLVEEAGVTRSKNEDSEIEDPGFGNVSTSFPTSFHFAFNPGTTLVYFVPNGAQNTRKTKDNALRYLYTMLVVKMRRKKRGGCECSKVERGGWR